MPLISADTKLYVRQLIKIFGKFFLSVAALWAVFYYVGNFTNLQSWILGLVIASAIDIAAGRQRPEEESLYAAPRVVRT